MVPTLVGDSAVFPAPVADFLVVAILAAAMSSLDSVLLVAASVTARDIVAPLRKSRREGAASGVVPWTRIGIIAYAAIAALVALKPPGGIVELTIFSGSLFAVCFVPTILLGLHWRRGNEAAALAAFGLGVAVLLGWLLLGYDAVVHEVFPALAVSTAAYVALSLRGERVRTEAVRRQFAGAATTAAK